MSISKKILAFIAVLSIFSALFVSCANAQRKEINSFMTEYEKIVKEAEKEANAKNVDSFMALATKNDAFMEKVGAFEETDEWTKKDDEKLYALTNRYVIAMAALSSDSTLDELKAALDSAAAAEKAK